MDIESVVAERTLSEREELIGALLDRADKYRWAAFLELYDISRLKLWREVVAENGEQVYFSWDDYLEDLSGKIPALSRRVAFERLRTIKQYKSLGMSDDEIKERSPKALSEAANLLQWDRRTGKPKNGTLTVDDFKLFVEDTKNLRVADVKALVEEMKGETRILFFGTLTPSFNDNECYPMLRGVDSDGCVYFMKANDPWPRELVKEIGRRLGIDWDESNG